MYLFILQTTVGSTTNWDPELIWIHVRTFPDPGNDFSFVPFFINIILEEFQMNVAEYELCCLVLVNQTNIKPILNQCWACAVLESQTHFRYLNQLLHIDCFIFSSCSVLFTDPRGRLKSNQLNWCWQVSSYCFVFFVENFLSLLTWLTCPWQNFTI